MSAFYIYCLKHQQRKWVILSDLSSLSKTQCHVSHFPVPKILEHKIALMILIPHAEASIEIQNNQTGQKEKMREFDLFHH